MTNNYKQEVINQFYYKRNIFRLIEGFINVVQQKSFIKASKLMNIAPSVVSTQINVLEKEFGVTLIKRSRGSKNFSLTEEGKLFYGSVNEIFVALDNTIVNLHKSLINYKNTIRIACHPLVASLIIPDITREMIVNHPEIKFIIQEISYIEALEELQNGNIDIIIYSKELHVFPKNNNFTIIKLWKYNAKTFCHPKHKAATMQDDKIELKDLINDNFVGLANTNYTVEKVGHILLDNTAIIKVSYSNVLPTVKSIQGVTVTDERIMKISDIKDLIIKDTPQIAQNAYFCIITNKKPNEYKLIQECTELMIKIANKIDKDNI